MLKMRAPSTSRRPKGRPNFTQIRCIFHISRGTRPPPVILERVARSRTLLALAFTVSTGLLNTCAEPKEAADPHQFILGEMEDPAESAARVGPARSAPPAAEAATRQADPPASVTECRAAARRVVELGLRAGGTPTSEPRAPFDENQRRALEQRATDECRSWNTPRSEALCVARAKRESDLENCTR